MFCDRKFHYLISRTNHEYILAMTRQTSDKHRGPGNDKTKFSVGVAMSGGVDSSVTAKLLKNMGHNVHGFFMALSQPDLERQIERAKMVAAHLDIKLTVVDLAAEFKKSVLDYFIQSYFKGKTPNPCIMCNPRIKFGRLLEEILARGCDLMATGHYARIVQTQDNTFHLLKGLDPQKDQSYFLHRLNQEQLARIIMPLGEQTKENVYKIAAELGLSGVHGAESQDVCFLKDQDLHTFMDQYIDQDRSMGPIVTRDGKVLGKHKGIQYYTVGQRKGLGLPDATPYYVVALDPVQNAVVIGKKDDLLQGDMSVGEMNWLAGDEPTLPRDFLTKVRYRHKGALVHVLRPENKVYTVRFHKPQAAITPGQFAVFYEGDEVIGGGVIL
jgi:tRNA-specific 2-thiouridylase